MMSSEYQLESETRSKCELLRAVAVAEQQGGIPQCTEGGRFRPVQCSGRGHECWCVDAKGQEVVGTRTNSPSPCQLQSVLRCSASGLFESVQCESSRGQCWCVDQDGMELYGTRQSGTPQRCPGSCEVRGRRLLHGSAPRSPPQCAADGSFLPVQCQFINTTDRREVDLLHAFNSFPEAFETFSSFRKFFPMVSSFCFCSDSRGRELENTGPSPCEEERRAAASGVFVPSCDDGGRFSSRQCQQGGQCWCVDPTGRERPGTRQLGDALVCSLDDCLSQRRRALSRLFSGPVAPPLLGNSSGKSPASSCLSLLRPLRDVLPVEADPTSFLSRLVEVLQGLFPSVGGAVRALSGASSRRLQENLFGGKFLKNAAALNLSGAVGARGALGLERLSSLSLMKNRDLVRYVSRALEDDAFLSVLTPLLRSCSAHEDHDGAAIFVPSCKSDGGFREVQCQGGGACWCVDPQGREVAGSRSSGRRPRCPSRCERERAAALEVKGNMAAGAEIHIPACSEDGDFLPLQCVGSRCFCVNAEGRPMTAGPTGGAVTCKSLNLLTDSEKLIRKTIETCHCARALAEVTAFTEQAKGIVALSGSSHLPLGYGFLLADGLRLTADELQVRRSQEELQISETLLSRSNAALQLAAYSSDVTLTDSGCTHSVTTAQVTHTHTHTHTHLYSINNCDTHTLCSRVCCPCPGQCWCVDEEGDYVPNSLTSRSLSLPKCQTRCQRARARTLLSGWTKGTSTHTHTHTHTQSKLITFYLNACVCVFQDGRYSVLQTGGAAGWCVNPLTGDWIQTATRGALQGRQCRPDGSFVPLQCDVTSCWCVSMDGQEVGGTRMPVQTGQTPSCDRPLCPDPVVTHGALLCRPAADGRQSCDLVCHHGYHNTLPVGSFLCETEGRRWDGADKPLSGACQSECGLQRAEERESIWKYDFKAYLPVCVCVFVCPAGSFSREGVCLLCPQGTYQDEEGRGFCNSCPRGSSPAGASSVDQCVTECQRQGLRCSERGDFLSGQPDFLSGRWRCVSSEGAKLEWTDSDKALTDEECSGEDAPANHRAAVWIYRCVCEALCNVSCAAEPSCLHVALFNTQCELYSTHTLNTHCNTSQQVHTHKQTLNTHCNTSQQVHTHKQTLNTHCNTSQQAVSGVFRTQVFSGHTSLSDAHRFCQDGCDHDTCCDGFILNQNRLHGGSVLCGWLRTPSVLMCGDQDWDVIGQGAASRICGAGLSYNEQQRSFVFDFGGQEFTISERRDTYTSVPSAPSVLSVVTGLCVCVHTSSQRFSTDDVHNFYLTTLCVCVCVRFMQCERRCDEDPCCRGIGFVRDTESPGGADVVCLSLISLGVQTCGEDHMTSWRTQDCRPSAVKTSPDPFGWYLKPVNQWSSAPALCPSFSLSPRNVSLDEWRLLSDSSVLVDPSVSTYDIIHISRDIATDRNKTRDWCLHGNHSRTLINPSPSRTFPSAPGSSRPSTSCRLVIREPAPQVYLRTERSQPVTTVSVPGHGILQGVAVKTTLGSDQKTVVQFLGVPYARPPIGSLRFQDAQPADWTGTWDATKPRPSCLQPGDAASSSSSSENCLYLNIFSPAAQVSLGRVPVLVFFFNPSASQKPGLLDGSTLAAVGNIVVVTAHYRTAALGFLSTGESGLPGNYGLSDQEAVLRWVNAHISLMGGDNSRVTVGAERGGADMTSLHLLVSSSLSPPLFQRMMLMGGSVFSPSLLHSSSSSSSRQQTLDLAKELGCVTSDLVACLRTTPVDKLNAAQTKLLAVSGPFRSWSPVLRRSDSPLSLRGVDLLLGSLEQDGLIVRARRVKDFEALQGRADGKTAFYEALRRSLGGEAGSELLKEAASWFYSLDHGPSPAGYNLFSRALDNATRDLFITCPGLRMASHWANGGANVFLYHQPASAADHRADASVPLDVQFVFGTPHHPISSQRFPTSGRRLSLAMMTYVSSFVRTGNPNPSRVWEESVLPRWQPVQSSEATPTYLEISPALRHRQGLRQKPCSFWSQMGTRLSQGTGESLEETFRPVLILESSSAMSQSQAEKDTYS
uniref:Thyroglobulin n=1 Tax=Scophthalmus maximus TaxID=52904 RepID=A0A8D3BNI0_SCOMX